MMLKNQLTVLTLLWVVASSNRKFALLVIDVQDCFLPGGSLAVKDGEQVIPVINKLLENYEKKLDLVVFSKDWHPNGHVSFASSFQNKQISQQVKLNYTKTGQLCQSNDVTLVNFPNSTKCEVSSPKNDLSPYTQVLWPDHCIQEVETGMTSSKLSHQLIQRPNDVIVLKGYVQEIDSYSAFFDKNHFVSTGLDKILKKHGIHEVLVTGLALDYCVYFTALDAKELGFETSVLLDAARGVNDVTIDKAVKDMAKQGVNLIHYDQLDDVFNKACSPLHQKASLQYSMQALVCFLITKFYTQYIM